MDVLNHYKFTHTASTTTGQSLMQFVRHVAENYLTSEHREVRLEGVRTCCHLLRPTFATLGRRTSQSQTHIVFNIVSKVLWVSVTDMGQCKNLVFLFESSPMCVLVLTVCGVYLYGC